MKIVVKVSGHLISSKDNLINHEYLKRVANVLIQLRKEGHKVYAVTGGGLSARYYINAARALGANEGLCDEVGINVARLHAMLLISALGNYALSKIPRTVQEFLDLATSSDKIIVMGGFQPGQSTTAVASLVAEVINADLLIITSDIDGIYTSDPKVNPNARKLDEVHINQLEEIFKDQKVKAGLYKMVDHVTLSVLKRSRIATRFIKGEPPENIIKVVKGEPLGTLIVY